MRPSVIYCDVPVCCCSCINAKKRLMKYPILLLIRFYQKYISAGLPSGCRYDPT
ncbi:MAG: membrane protein insertion efficiency factor YidD, partial [Anaerolineae bacterium]